MIALASGKDGETMPLRLEVLFNEDMVVRNSRLNGEWTDDDGERDNNRYPHTLGNPLVAGIV